MIERVEKKKQQKNSLKSSQDLNLKNKIKGCLEWTTQSVQWLGRS